MAKKDLLAERTAREATLQKLLTERPIEAEVSAPIESARQRRQDLLTQIGGAPGVSPGFARAFGERQSPVLERQASAFADKQRLALQRQRFNLVFNNALQMATEAGVDVRTAEDFAKRIAEQDREQQFESEELEKNREFKRQQSRLADIYAEKGIALEQQFEPQSDYESALIRALTGVGAAVGTAKFLGKKPVPEETPIIKAPGQPTPGSILDRMLRANENVGNFPLPSESFGGRGLGYPIGRRTRILPSQFGGQSRA